MACEAMVLYGCARLAIAVVPFRLIAPWLGEVGGESRAVLKDQEIRTARLVGGAVTRATHLQRATGTCLAQAIAAHLMLRRRGIPSTVYFGIAIQCWTMTAHAWVRSGGAILTGKTGHERFRVVSTFAQPRLRPSVAVSTIPGIS